MYLRLLRCLHGWLLALCPARCHFQICHIRMRLSLRGKTPYSYFGLRHSCISSVIVSSYFLSFLRSHIFYCVDPFGKWERGSCIFLLIFRRIRTSFTRRRFCGRFPARWWMVFHGVCRGS